MPIGELSPCFFRNQLFPESVYLDAALQRPVAPADLGLLNDARGSILTPFEVEPIATGHTRRDVLVARRRKLFPRVHRSVCREILAAWTQAGHRRCRDYR